MSKELPSVLAVRMRVMCGVKNQYLCRFLQKRRTSYWLTSSVPVVSTHSIFILNILCTLQTNETMVTILVA